MTDLPGFLPCFGVTGPWCCIVKATKKLFRSFFRLNIEIVWSLRTNDGKEEVAKKIFWV